jgi:hypothetical protein
MEGQGIGVAKEQIGSSSRSSLKEQDWMETQSTTAGGPKVHTLSVAVEGQADREAAENSISPVADSGNEEGGEDGGGGGMGGTDNAVAAPGLGVRQNIVEGVNRALASVVVAMKRASSSAAVFSRSKEAVEGAEGAEGQGGAAGRVRVAWASLQYLLQKHWTPIFFDTFNWAKDLSWGFLVFLIILSYVSGGLLFAVLMIPLKSQFVFDDSVAEVDFEDLFFFASSNLISLGAEYGYANSRGTHWVIMVTHFCGILMNLLLFGVLLAKFTHKKSGLILGKVVLSKVAGRPCLTFRIGHMRGSHMSMPTVRMAVLSMKQVNDPGSAGRYAAVFPLKIVGGDVHAMAPPSYYCRHFIDEQSPLHDASSVSSTVFESVFRNAGVNIFEPGFTGSAVTKLNITSQMLEQQAALSISPDPIDATVFHPFALRMALVAQDPREVGFSSVESVFRLSSVKVNHTFVDCLSVPSTAKTRQKGLQTRSNIVGVDFKSFNTTRPLKVLDEKDVHNVLPFGEAGEAGKDFVRPTKSAEEATAKAVKMVAAVAAAAAAASAEIVIAVEARVAAVELEAAAAMQTDAETEKRPSLKTVSSVVRRTSLNIYRSVGRHSSTIGRYASTINAIIDPPTGPGAHDDLLVQTRANDLHGAHGGMYRAKFKTSTGGSNRVLGHHGRFAALWPVLFDTFDWAQSLSWRNLTLLIIAAYSFIAMLFAALMVPFASGFVFDESMWGVSDDVGEGTARVYFELLVYFASGHLFSMGVEYGYPNSRATHQIVMLMHLSSSLMNLLLFGVMLAKFTTTKSGLVIAPKATLTVFEGRPCLTFRYGHIRGSTLAHPHLVGMLAFKTEATALGGDSFYVPFPVSFTYTTGMAAFPASFYIRHFIDEHSPFYDKHSESGTIFDRTLNGDLSHFVHTSDQMRRTMGHPEDSNALMLMPSFMCVTLTGFDPSIQAFANCSCRFNLRSRDSIVVNENFKDAISNVNKLDLGKFLSTEAVAADCPHRIAISLSPDAVLGNDDTPFTTLLGSDDMGDNMRQDSTPEIHLNPLASVNFASSNSGLETQI